MFQVITSDPPPVTSVRAPSVRYPFNNLGVGHSFVVPADKAHAVRAAVHYRGKAHGERYTTKRLDDGSLQVWRVA